MGYSVLEKWSQKSSSATPGTASKGMRVFTVAGTGATVVTDETAKTAVDSVSGLAVPLIGNQYSASWTWLCCNDVTAHLVSLNLVEVVCSYGSGQFFAPVAPLNEPEIIQWGQTTYTEETDRDADANPILNLCGSVLTGCKQTYYIDSLSITRNISAFDLSVARTYRNTVNSADLTIYTAGTGVLIPAGYMRCVSILPTKPYKVLDAYVPVCATFEIADSNALANPFQWRLINSGYEAYDSNQKKGRIVFSTSGQAVTHPVLFDINGKPYDTTNYGIKQQKGNAVNTTFSVATPAAAIKTAMTMAPDNTTSAYCTYLFYRKCKAANFASLFSTLGIT
jgi:hypothetical protein